MDMFDPEKRKKIEYYIAKLQNILTKAIADSKEMQELKKLINSEETDIQFCIFSLMMDRHTAESLKDMDGEFLHKLIMEAHENMNIHSKDTMGDVSWTDDDKTFLKSLKIIL